MVTSEIWVTEVPSEATREPRCRGWECQSPFWQPLLSHPCSCLWNTEVLLCSWLLIRDHSKDLTNSCSGIVSQWNFHWKVKRWVEGWKRWGCYFLTGKCGACSKRGGFALVEMAEEVLKHSDVFWEDPMNSQLLLPKWFLAVFGTLIHQLFCIRTNTLAKAVLEGKATHPLMICPNVY